MGRRIPQSGKAKKTKLQVQRASAAAAHVKTPHPEDEQAHQLAQATSRQNAALLVPSGRPSGSRTRTVEQAERHDKKEVQLRLESRFLKLPLDLLNHHRLVSATQPLERPIPAQLGYCLTQDLQPAELEGLTVPKRPKWRYSQTKLEVEKNEEGLFTQWLHTTDTLLATFASSLPSTPAPSFFERNLQVWRQLWRVTEASEILLVLVDVRFPLIHYSPSLEAYVKSLRPRKEVIIVLTKTDLVPKWLSAAWKEWFEEREGPEGASVVIMESYKQIEQSGATQGTQPRFAPSAPPASRLALISALRKAHTKLLQPPAVVADFPERLAKWKPGLRINVDFDSVEHVAEGDLVDLEEAERAHIFATASGSTEPAPVVVVAKKEKKTRRSKTKDVYIPRTKKPLPGEEEEEGEDEEVEAIVEEEETVAVQLEGDDAHPYLTIGLIGCPNVGKSSTINALLGRKVVRASKTPGKTKSLQTIFWNSTIRLCDCPGLVFPSFAGMERQVLSGVLPIQNVEPVLYFIAQRMPLETILKLHHSVDEEFGPDEEPYWTADSILTAYALSQGFLTAKAGRPDLYRAGAFVMRQIHSSAIPWSFVPPAGRDKVPRPKEGIYLSGFNPRSISATQEAVRRAREQENEEESGSEESRAGSEEDEQDAEDDEDEDGAEGDAVAAIQSAFAGLEVEGGEDSDEEEDEED